MDEDQKQQYEEFRKTIATSNFSTDSYLRRVEKPWGWEIHFTPDDLPYMGKILHINEGAQFSMQSHDTKQESWFLRTGNLLLLLEDSEGEMKEIKIKPGVGFTCALGQKHRIRGGEGGGEVFEVSTPELGKTYRLEDDYSRKTETAEEREKRNSNTLG